MDHMTCEGQLNINKSLNKTMYLDTVVIKELKIINISMFKVT